MISKETERLTLLIEVAAAKFVYRTMKEMQMTGEQSLEQPVVLAMMQATAVAKKLNEHVSPNVKKKRIKRMVRMIDNIISSKEKA